MSEPFNAEKWAREWFDRVLYVRIPAREPLAELVALLTQAHEAGRREGIEWAARACATQAERAKDAGFWAGVDAHEADVARIRQLLDTEPSGER